MSSNKCPHGVPFQHPTAYCPICLKEAMRGESLDAEQQPPPREPNIKSLELLFPHGATSGECQKISIYAEKIVGASVSEGGYKPKGPYGIYADNVTFIPDQYTFTFGYKKDI